MKETGTEELSGTETELTTPMTQAGIRSPGAPRVNSM